MFFALSLFLLPAAVVAFSIDGPVYNVVQDTMLPESAQGVRRRPVNSLELDDKMDMNSVKPLRTQHNQLSSRVVVPTKVTASEERSPAIRKVFRELLDRSYAIQDRRGIDLSPVGLGYFGNGENVGFNLAKGRFCRQEGPQAGNFIDLRTRNCLDLAFLNNFFGDWLYRR